MYTWPGKVGGGRLNGWNRSFLNMHYKDTSFFFKTYKDKLVKQYQNTNCYDHMELKPGLHISFAANLPS